MILVATLIALILERLIPELDERRSLHWFAVLRGRVWGALPEGLRRGGAGLGLALLLPVGGLGLFAGWIEGWLWGLPALMLAIVVLFLALRPGGVDEAIDGYIAARAAGEEGTARHHAQNLIATEMPADLEGEVRAVADSVLWQSLERLFSVLFWFFLLGPVGALFYRLCVELAQDKDSVETGVAEAARAVLAVLDWAPARLLAGGFILAGSFEDGVAAWTEDSAPVGQSEDAVPDFATRVEAGNRACVLRVGRGALRAEAQEITSELGETGLMQADVSLVRGARGLVLRTLVIWLAVLSLLTLAGVVI